ncbi:hypothetical protein FH972_020686 [Carpinus fangiana]|uniref:Nucleotide-diphospho-sugar transferase domain-containing protein n=1 Tax=Carpinus fangiana TaxID=176857 RepID=A0A5N6RU84_9ROSI|nr:hypothetical protein FH972_020686 [Carpinus fangiana]
MSNSEAGAADPINDSKPSYSGGNHLAVNRVVNAMLLLGGAAALIGLLLYNSAYPFRFLPGSYHGASESPFPCEAKDLNSVLKNASMEDRTVILTTLNDAWAEPNSMFDLFLESFRIGNGTQRLLKNLVVICLDRKAYCRCLYLHPHCYYLDTTKLGDNFTSEAVFMTPTYIHMMWARIDLLASILEMGYNFVFTDTDVMWLQDPFQRFYSEADFQIACDQFFGNSSDVNNNPNGGFNYVKSNNRTVKFYKFWYKSREAYPGNHDQDVLNKIKGDPFIREIGLKMRFLDTAYFGGFCEPSRDLNLVCTMHANCCVGLDNKVYDLRILLDNWTKFMSLPQSMKASPPSSWTVPQKCRDSLERSRKNGTR